MLPAEIKQLIARLDPGSFTAFVEGLLSAEAARLGMPPGSLVMSDALTENDEGLDARLPNIPGLAPDGKKSVLPAGPLAGFQLKATRKKQPSAFELSDELDKPGPRQVLSSGGTYVLVSSQDLNPAQRQALETALLKEAAAVLNKAGVRTTPSTAVWDAQTLADLSQINPNPAIAIGLQDFEIALTLNELLELLRAHERPFQSDQSRDQAIDRLRDRARSSTGPLLMSLHGEPGTGKTRVVAHALDMDEFRDRVLWVNGNEDLQILLTRLIRNRTSTGILIADEIDEHAMATAAQKLGGIGERWRIVSITSRTHSRWISEGGRNVVLRPLDGEATRTLVEQHSMLPKPQAELVARVAAGFPELAFRLADELREDPTLDLVRLSRLPYPQEILDRAFGDREARRHLAPLALFTGVGFDGELHYQLELVSRAFDLDADTVSMHCDSELGRFVSRAGSYRLISPLLVAVWLATDLFEHTARIEDRILRLPEPLQEAFIHQLDYFGPGAPHLPAALSRILQDPRFRGPAGFNEAAGRLLRAAAAIIPSQVAESIQDLLRACSNDDLLRIPRRDLVWAAQTLLWWPETWSAAVDILYLLAQHENETWANNASSQFAAAFTLYLSGSVLPYADRAEWLKEAIDQAALKHLELLANAAVAGLSTHHFREVVGFRGGGEPRDWQPRSEEEYIEARRTGWELLLRIRDKADAATRPALTKRLADAIRTAYRSRLGEYIESSLLSRDWSPEERSLLSSGLRDVIRYEQDMPSSLRGSVQSLHDWLVGDDLPDRLTVLLNTSIWDLHESNETIQDTPPLLIDLADRLVANEDGLQLALQAGQELGNQETRYALFRLLADRLSAETVGVAAIESGDWAAVYAALSAADANGEEAWANSVLAAQAEEDPSRVPELLVPLNLTPSRLELVLSLVESGRAPGIALSRLIYGARIRALGEDLALRLIRAVQVSQAVEPALGMLDQWLEQHPDRSAAARLLAGELAIAALSDAGSTMIDFYVQRLVETDVLPPAVLVDLWQVRMLNREGLVENLDRILTERALAVAPEEMTNRIFDLVRQQVTGRASFSLLGTQDLNLLSRLAEETFTSAVWSELRDWPERELRWALHHMDWSGSQPDPLVREFLTSGRLAEMENEASACFFNTLGVVMGPMSAALERELERASSWRRSLSGSSASHWADDLVRGYRADVQAHKRREEEEDLRLS
jgi:hypothetical protein